MSRLPQVFKTLSEKNSKALITFVTAGHPTVDTTVPIMHDLVVAGADILELGMPFSDPVAEGPVIQRSSEVALANGMTPKHVFDMVKQFRQTDDVTPVVLMGYLNPIEIIGYENFVSQAHAAGADGFIIVDLPAAEGQAFVEVATAHSMDVIFLLSPTTNDERAQQICDMSSGFHYYVSFKGVTGAGTLDLQECQARIQHLREFSRLPIALGFGVRDGETAQAVARFADAVVVGSALVKLLNDADTLEVGRESLRLLVSEMRRSMDEVK